MDSNSEGSEGNPSPDKDDVYYGSVARRRIWRSMSSEDRYGMWCSFSPAMTKAASGRCSDGRLSCAGSLPCTVSA